MAAGFGGANGSGANDTGVTNAPVDCRVLCRSERWIGNIDGVLGDPIIAQSLLKNPPIVSPDPVAQVIEQFDDRERLIG